MRHKISDWKRDIIDTVDWGLFYRLAETVDYKMFDEYEPVVYGKDGRNGWYLHQSSNKFRHYVDGRQHHSTLPAIVSDSVQFHYRGGDVYSVIDEGLWAYAVKDYKGETSVCFLDETVEHPHCYHRPVEFNSMGYECWYIHGRFIEGRKYFDWCVEMGIDLFNIMPEDKVIIDLKWNKH